MKYNHSYKSDEEYFFALWCEDLKRHGYLKSYKYQYPTVEIIPKQAIGYRRLRNKTYTGDFYLEWYVTPTFVKEVNTRLKKKPYDVLMHRDMITIVDVKGGGYSGKYQNSDVEFPIIQKMLLYYKGMWVDKFIVSNKKNNCFDKTFTPREFLLTPTGQQKKLHYKPKFIEDVKSN